MPVFSIETPSGKVLDIEAPDEATALRGAKEWHQQNKPNPLPSHPLIQALSVPSMVKGAYEALKSGAEATRDAAAGEVQDPTKVFAAAGLGVGMSPAAGSGAGLAQVAGVGKPMTPQMAQATRMMQEGLPRTPSAEGVAQAGEAAVERPRAGYFETLQEGGYPLRGAATVEEANLRLQRAGSSQPEGFFGAELPQAGLAPAHLYKDGTVAVGKSGQLHFDIIDPRYKGNPDRFSNIKESGFVTPQGQYLSREEAFKWVKANEGKIKSPGGQTLDAKEYLEQIAPSARLPGGASLDDVIGFAQSSGIEQIKALGRLRSRMVPAEWADVQSAAIQRLGEGPNGFDATAYFKNYGALTPSGKRVLFGSTKDGKALMRHLDTIHEAATEVVRAAEAAQPQAAPSLADSFGRMLGRAVGRSTAKTVTSALGLGALVGEPVSILVSVLGAQAVSRALSNNAGAASTAAWAKSYSQLLRNPSPSTYSQFNIMTRNLGNTLGEPIDQKKLLDAAGIQVEELRT